MEEYSSNFKREFDVLYMNLFIYANGKFSIKFQQTSAVLSTVIKGVSCLKTIK